LYAAFAKLITLTSILSRTEGEEVVAYAITLDEKICALVAPTVPADTERMFGEGYLRFSVANSIENIKQALDRIDALDEKKPVGRPLRLPRGRRCACPTI
jgi:hypothetical protein